MIPIRKAACVLVCITVIIVAVIVGFNGTKENSSQPIQSNPENMATANSIEIMQSTDTKTPNPIVDVKVIEQDEIVSTPIIVYLNTVIPNAEVTKVPNNNEEVIPAYNEDIVTTETPTQAPIETPTGAPTPVPTEVPTQVPTEVPTPVPTEVPTQVPTEVPTQVPTAIPDVGDENFKNIQLEISKTGCGFLHEVLPKFGGEKKHDFHHYIDLTSVDRNELYECLKEFFVTTIAHSFEFDFSSGNLDTILESAYCNKCGNLKLEYIDSNTEKMSKVFNSSYVDVEIDVMLNFMYENTIANEDNPNERLFVCCDCN